MTRKVTALILTGTLGLGLAPNSGRAQDAAQALRREAAYRRIQIGIIRQERLRLEKERRDLRGKISKREGLLTNNEKVRQKLEPFETRITERQQQILSLERTAREDAFKAADPELAGMYKRRDEIKTELAELQKSGGKVVDRKRQSVLWQEQRSLGAATTSKVSELKGNNQEVQQKLSEIDTEITGLQDQIKGFNNQRKEVFKAADSGLTSLYERRDEIGPELAELQQKLRGNVAAGLSAAKAQAAAQDALRSNP